MRQAKINQRLLTRRKNRRGAMLVLLCVMIFAFFVTVAFSVDIAYMHLVRSELRASTDAAAKAAAEALSRTQDTNQAIAQGKAIALENQVAGKGLQLRDNDFQFGRSELNNATGRFDFSSAKKPFNSVRVSGERTSTSLSGGVNLFFGKIFGVGSFQPKELAAATYVDRDIVLVVDRSGSMLGQKFIDLKEGVKTFVTTLSLNPVDELVGLASYSSTATEDVQLSTNIGLLNTAMNAMPVNGNTSISRGMIAGNAIMSRSARSAFVERTLIVMTDGIHNTGPDPIGEAKVLAAKGIVIHTITFGADSDTARMKTIAAIGSGRHFHADSGLELKSVFREIALTLNTIVTE